jgi:hypothetical protein
MKSISTDDFRKQIHAVLKQVEQGRNSRSAVMFG